MTLETVDGFTIALVGFIDKDLTQQNGFFVELGRIHRQRSHLRITANQGFYLLGLYYTSPTFAVAIQNLVPWNHLSDGISK
ncbi:unnamed protein product [Rhodiola kirilowii]